MYNIIPIGDHCAISIILKELDLRKTSYPFDWTTNVDQLFDSNIPYHVDLIDKLKTESVQNIVKSYIGNAFDEGKKLNSVNNILFPHDKGSISDIIAKYERRFTRLQQDLCKKNMFVLLTRQYYINEDCFLKLMNVLLQYNDESIILFISGSDHAYFNNEKYSRVIFKYIHYDISQFYDYDYHTFRPELKAYLADKIWENHFII
jgi:hypothetical protein